ncbi:glucose dehydrogenase [FAD, quinone]-like isoform X2 [Anoplophora glabripennis]|uniref:glucose dehydrogenase [FAD, quinone]-like isoform X2 n=1 Tax=Anoplophora glabripennis TaxID=217634 RepID=UPI0008746985|nr:glucose dehydrogenase [FAD, quinone]-like isoform X2 [Anoplophora glabripennis]
MRGFIRTFIIFLFSVVICNSQVQEIFRDIRRLFNIGDGVIDDAEDISAEYDFIVIGAGSGGSVVANRLTENPKWTVLLLEAGRDESFITDIPLLAAFQSTTGYNWGYKSEKLKTACLGLIDGRCNIARGKALGGTSVTNFLLYTRGSRLDFDMWSRMGNEGWSYDEVLPYFIKSENCTSCGEIDKPFHGTDGYLNIEHPGYESPTVKLFLKTGLDLGYKNNDPNGKIGLGFSRVQATMKNGARCSAAKAFLKPIRYRRNLHILTQSRVTKLLINPQTKQTYGVEFLRNRKKYSIRVKKEVILSAGSVNSPQILMLSGVGPRDVLGKAKIKIIQDLKVGYNLQDHMAMSTLTFLVNESVTVSDRQMQNPVHIYNYLVRGKGPYTIPGGAEALAFIKTKYSTSSDDYPDIELVLGAGALTGDTFGSFRGLLGIPDSLYQRVYEPLSNRSAFGIATVLLRPKSKGRVLIKDSNPLHWPIIRPNYFEEEEDIATMVEGIKTAISIAASKHFQKYNTTLNTIPFPGCENIVFGTDEYWACAIRHVATTLGHQVGTCKMGPVTDPEAVVDPQLRLVIRML